MTPTDRYHCYTEAEVVDNARRGQRLFLDLGDRQCWLVWNSFAQFNAPHCHFYAASTGWEALTITGYRSTFFRSPDFPVNPVSPFGDAIDHQEAKAVLKLIHEDAGIPFE